MDHKLRIMIFFLAFDRFFQSIDLEFLVSTGRLFHSFVQYGKKLFLKEFVLDKKGLITDTDTYLKGLFI